MHLAQFNIAEAIAPMDSPVMADFINNTDTINALAEKSPGFVWRFTDKDGADAYSVRAYESDFILVNMSVWKDRESLFKFVYQSEHVEIFRRKKEWFAKMPKMHMVLWHVEDGHEPTVEEGKERLAYLQKHGETLHAFSFKSAF
ncbi:MAG: DUF3291 domain-containing protein [Altibacter sp.]|uniref:DUF3291 domain-containing protein n=1 Tax=Altibacter sp. TaxID=2024823 RepID=UPI001DA107B7|nr:DUF3291 domain-containing protein [Altibacter sp.]MBZ0328335.1 DUF3291 domain-containing protein [Altibacter sp.]